MKINHSFKKGQQGKFCLHVVASIDTTKFTKAIKDTMISMVVLGSSKGNK